MTGAAAAVRTTEAGVPVLVGYLAVLSADDFDRGAARSALAKSLPSAIVPLLALVDELPVRTSGKVDRERCRGRCRGRGAGRGLHRHRGVAGRAVAGGARDAGARRGPRTSSISAAGRSPRPSSSRASGRACPEFSVADIYDVPRLGAMAKALGVDHGREDAAAFRQPEPTPRSTQWVQTLLGIPLFILTGIRWLLYLLTASALLHLAPGFEVLPTAPLVAAGHRAAGLRDALRAHGAVGGVRARSSSPGSSPAITLAAERRTCGCGSPSRSPTRSMPWDSPVRRG